MRNHARPIPDRMRKATAAAIERIARATAAQATGERQQAACEHLKRIERRKRDERAS